MAENRNAVMYAEDWNSPVPTSTTSGARLKRKGSKKSIKKDASVDQKQQVPPPGVSRFSKLFDANTSTSTPK